MDDLFIAKPKPKYLKNGTKLLVILFQYFSNLCSLSPKPLKRNYMQKYCNICGIHKSPTGLILRSDISKLSCKHCGLNTSFHSWLAVEYVGLFVVHIALIIILSHLVSWIRVVNKSKDVCSSSRTEMFPNQTIMHANYT